MARALVLEGPRTLRLREEAAPRLQARDVRMRALASGISHGTELNLYRGTSGFAELVFDRELRAFVRPNPPRPAYPAMLGYEMVGVIEEVGSSVAELRVGDPAWDRQRVMRTVVELLAKGRVRVDSLPMREFPFERAVEAYQWLDANPREAVKVALTYEGGNHSGGEQ